MFWHIDTDIVALIVITLIIFCNQKTKGANEVSIRDQRFSKCLGAGIIVTAIDILSSVIMVIPTNPIIYHMCMTAYFIGIELLIVEWFVYVLALLYAKRQRVGRTIAHCCVFLFGVFVMMALSNPWTGLLYSLGENNKYNRGPLFNSMIVLFLIYIALLFVLIFIRWNNIPKSYPKQVLILTPIILGLGIALQLLIPGWLMILPSFMICLLLAFLFLQTIRVRDGMKMVKDLEIEAETDPLTGLLNRKGMDIMVGHTLENAMGEPVIVLILDIDDLKQINDSMGHDEGDRAIYLVASTIKEFFKTEGTVVRFGGDEFIAFLTGEDNVKYAEGRLRELLKAIIKIRIGGDSSVGIRCSIGASCGTVGEDSFKDLCKKADIALYYVKRNGKSDVALYLPEMDIDE